MSKYTLIIIAIIITWILIIGFLIAGIVLHDSFYIALATFIAVVLQAKINIKY